MYSSYNYLVNNIKAEKKVTYNVLFYQNESFLKKILVLKKLKILKSQVVLTRRMKIIIL